MILRNSMLIFFIYCTYTITYAQNAPVTNAPIISSCTGSSIDVQITVTDFNDIGAVSLTLHFNAPALVFDSYTNDSGFPGLVVFNPNPGVITAAGFSVNSGISIPDNEPLFTIHFTMLGGDSGLSWFDDGSSCEYAGPPPTYIVLNDLPQESFYLNGAIIEIQAPSIVEQPVSPDTVEAGNGIAIFEVLAQGEGLEYQWQEYVNSWNDIIEGGVYEGSLSDILNIVDPPIEMNGYNYRCIVSGTCDPHSISDGTATLTVVYTVGVAKYNGNHGSNTIITIKAYPNPFSKRIVLDYYLPLSGRLFVEIIDFKGDIARKFIKGPEAKGNHTLKLNLDYLKTGIYTARFRLMSNNKTLSSSTIIVCNE